jgi:hypothetical protein
VYHGTIHKEKPNKMQQCIKIFIITYLYEAQHVSGATPPIIRSLKLHWQPLVFHTWKDVGRCQAQCACERALLNFFMTYIALILVFDYAASEIYD